MLGDMLELGAATSRFHQEVVPGVIGVDPDLVVLVGAEMPKLAPLIKKTGAQVEVAENVEHVIERLPKLILDGDNIFVKSSNGVRLWSLVERILAN